MSAYIVSHDHINAIATFAHMNKVRVSYYADHINAEDADDAARLAGILYAANVASVNHRYNDNESAKGYTFSLYRNRAMLTPDNIINALRCYDYQACELPQYETSHAAIIVHAIMAAAAATFASKARVSWDMPDDTPAPAQQQQQPQPKADPATDASKVTAALFASLRPNSPKLAARAGVTLKKQPKPQDDEPF